MPDWGIVKLLQPWFLGWMAIQDLSLHCALIHEIYSYWEEEECVSLFFSQCSALEREDQGWDSSVLGEGRAARCQVIVSSGQRSVELKQFLRTEVITRPPPPPTPPMTLSSPKLLQPLPGTKPSANVCLCFFVWSMLFPPGQKPHLISLHNHLSPRTWCGRTSREAGMKTFSFES